MLRLLPLDSGGVMLSYRCPCACRHCVYACGPGWKEWMSRDWLEALLRGVARVWEAPRGLHLAGGEAFLDFDLLLFGVEKCRELGLALEYVETNACWFVDEERGRERLRLLREAGLERVLISVSPFHAETVPPSRTLAAVTAAREVFGPGGVIVYLERFLRPLLELGGGRPVPLSRWVETYGPEGAGRLFWEGYALIPGGRAGVCLGHLAPARHPPERWAGETCAAELLLSRHAHFDPYRNYVPLFCGGISLGRFEDLPSFVRTYDYRQRPLIRVLVEEGPYGLYTLARRMGFAPASGGYAGKCHLCVEVRRFLVQQGEFSELAPRDFYRNLEEGCRNDAP